MNTRYPKYGLAVALAATAAGAAADISVILDVQTDRGYYGMSESDGEATAAVHVEWQSAGGWLAGGSVARPFELSPERNENGRKSPATVYLGRSWASSQGFVTASLRHRRYNNAPRDWAYEELSLQFSHRTGLALQLDYTDNLYDHDQESIHAFASWRGEVFAGAEVRVGFGWHAQAGGEDGRYAEVSVAKSVGRTLLDVGYGWHEQHGARHLGHQLEQPGIRASLAYLLY